MLLFVQVKTVGTFRIFMILFGVCFYSTYFIVCTLKYTVPTSLKKDKNPSLYLSLEMDMSLNVPGVSGPPEVMKVAY